MGVPLRGILVYLGCKRGTPMLGNTHFCLFFGGPGWRCRSYFLRAVQRRSYSPTRGCIFGFLVASERKQILSSKQSYGASMPALLLPHLGILSPAEQWCGGFKLKAKDPYQRGRPVHPSLRKNGEWFTQALHEVRVGFRVSGFRS